MIASLARFLSVFEGFLVDVLGVVGPGGGGAVGGAPHGEVAGGRAGGDGGVEADLKTEGVGMFAEGIHHALDKVALDAAVECLVRVLVRAPKDVEGGGVFVFDARRFEAGIRDAVDDGGEVTDVFGLSEIGGRRAAVEDLAADVVADFSQRAVDDVLAVLAERDFAVFQDLDHGHRLHRAPLPERGGVEVGLREDLFLQALEAGGVGLVELEFFSAGFGAVLPVGHWELRTKCRRRVTRLRFECAG